MASGLACKYMRLAKTGPTYFKITRFRANLRAQWIETTNAETVPGSGNVPEEFIYGIYGGDVDFEIVYQEADLLFAALQPGTTVAVTFYPDKTATGSNLAGNLSVETWELTGEEKDYFKCHVTGKFNGGYTATSL